MERLVCGSDFLDDLIEVRDAFRSPVEVGVEVAFLQWRGSFAVNYPMVAILMQKVAPTGQRDAMRIELQTGFHGFLSLRPKSPVVSAFQEFSSFDAAEGCTGDSGGPGPEDLVAKRPGRVTVGDGVHAGKITSWRFEGVNDAPVPRDMDVVVN